MSRMRVLVLGGNRYIGLHLVHELARRGHDVTVLNSHEAPLPEGTRRWHGDRRVPGVLTQILSDHRDEFDAVFDNTAHQIPDVEPLVELFRGRVEHYVFTSTTGVYRMSAAQPILESAPVPDTDERSPSRGYGAGKVRTENFLLAEHARSGFPVTCLRVTHTIGPHSPLGTREPAFFARLELGRPIPIPGEGFPFVHLVHVDDVASMMASILGNAGAAGKVYNCAGAEWTSVLGCVRLMAKAVGVQPEIVNVPMDVCRTLPRPLVHWNEAMVGGMVFSIDAALRDLDWAPKFGLLAAYEDSYRWFRDEGRERYTFDFSYDDEVLARLAR